MAEGECNLDDVLCQLEVLRGLKTIEGAVGKESFSERFPELHGLSGTIKESIASARVDLREALEKCGNDDLLKETLEGVDLNIHPEGAVVEPDEADYGQSNL